MVKIHSEIIPLNCLGKDLSFCQRRNLFDGELKMSIEKRGILVPLTVAGHKPYSVIAGHRRAEAAKCCGLKEIPVRLIDDKVSEQELFLFAVLSNWKQPFSGLDLAQTVHKATLLGFEEKEILDEIFPALGIPSHRQLLLEYLAIAGLDQGLQDLLDQGRMPLRGAHLWARFSSDDQRTAASAMLSRISLTSQRMIQLAEWLYDLLCLKKISLAQWLTQAPVIEVLDENTGDLRSRGEKLLTAVQGLRFPSIVEQKRKFEDHLASIHTPTQDLCIEAPAAFEDEGIVLKASIRNERSLEDLLEYLGSKRTSLNELLRLMI